MSIIDKVVAAVSPSAKEGELNAVDLLKQDHDDVQALFKDYELLAEDERATTDKRALSIEICGMLAVHAMIEEEIFYPAAREAGVEAALLNEAEIEHVPKDRHGLGGHRSSPPRAQGHIDAHVERVG